MQRSIDQYLYNLLFCVGGWGLRWAAMGCFGGCFKRWVLGGEGRVAGATRGLKRVQEGVEGVKGPGTRSLTKRLVGAKIRGEGGSWGAAGGQPRDTLANHAPCLGQDGRQTAPHAHQPLATARHHQTPPDTTTQHPLGHDNPVGDSQPAKAPFESVCTPDARHGRHTAAAPGGPWLLALHHHHHPSLWPSPRR